jgi:cytochrome P450
MRKLMNQALRQHNIRVYLMLAETKCAALRRSVGQQRRGEAACVAFEVSCVLPFRSIAVLSFPISSTCLVF